MENENIIEIKGLKKAFGENEVLKNINLSLKKGENLIVIGKSGQGKSVLIQCIVAMIQPDEGSIKVFDKEVTALNDDELKNLRTRIGFLFQSGALYDSMTVRENLEFPLQRVLKIKNEKEIEERSKEVLDAVGLADAIDKMPADLSGGMRKRMALARTLIEKPEIILYDEPTTGLDTITSKEISELIMQTQKNFHASSIIITHDMNCAKITSDRILVMNNGEFVAEGTYEELENSKDDFIRSFFN